MEQERRISALISENEFLQLQLEDLNNVIKSKEEEISLLGDGMDSAASLQSRIDGNLVEIEQLRYNMALAEQKNAGTEILNEELEINLLREIRERHKDQAVIKNLGTVKAELEIITNELDDAAPMYTKLQVLEDALTEQKSINVLLEEENTALKHEIAELQELLALLKKKKFE